MDDTLEDKAPKTKARTGSKSSRAADAPAAVKESKVRSAPAGQAKADAAKPVRKAPAKRKPRGATAPAPEPKGKPAKAAPAKWKTKAKAEPPAAAEVPAHPTAPEPAQPPEPVVHPEGPAGDVTIHPVAPHGPRAHPHDDGLEFGLSPVDLAPDASVREEEGLGWFIRILVLSSVLLVLFNSFAIDKWAREQPVTKLNSQVLIAAHQLHAGMKSAHLDAPLEGLRTVWHGIKAAQWPGLAAKSAKDIAR